MKNILRLLILACLSTVASAQTNIDPYTTTGKKSRIETEETQIKKLILPNVSLEDIPLEQCLDFLMHSAKEADVKEKDKSKKGVKIILDKALSKAVKSDKEEFLVTLNLGKDVPLETVIYFLCENLDIHCEVSKFGIVLKLEKE